MSKSTKREWIAPLRV